ncbi:hypothetical protein [Pontiella sp.]|uniref:hypothetical protein n=1 Tax=Pontiella sp. TaxID=2837462 RepID=UPI0035654C4C
MKSRTLNISGMVLMLLLCSVAKAAITVPGADGSDGALLITENTVIDLSLATTGEWDDAGAGNGVYDSNKWAVVFKYSSVVVSNGATLTFANHPSRAPVVWLVSGDVTIDGSLNLNGQSHQTAPVHAEPGPGGFRGGAGTYSSGAYAGAGFGIGGDRHVPHGGGLVRGAAAVDGDCLCRPARDHYAFRLAVCGSRIEFVLFRDRAGPVASHCGRHNQRGFGGGG